MKNLLLRIFLLGLVVTYSRAQDIETQAIQSGQQQQQHSVTQLIARNQIASLATVTYTAGKSVILQPGFTARAGSVFSASIRSGYGGEEGISKVSAKAYPNPFRQLTRIEYFLPRSNKVTYKLTNIQGQTIQQSGAEWQEAGQHHLDLPADGLPEGTYIYYLQVGAEQKAIRLVKQP